MGTRSWGIAFEVAARSASAALVAAVLATAASGCGASLVTVLEPGRVPVTLTPAHDVPLEVVTRKSGLVPDPIPLHGSAVALADVEAALGYAVATATAPWAELHMAARPEGWQLAVELISADARTRGHEVTATFGVRATLRTRAGNRYLAQTQTHCKRSAVVEPEQSGPVVLDCLARVGRELGGWLGGVNP